MAIHLLADDNGSNSLEYLRLHKEETGGLLGRHAKRLAEIEAEDAAADEAEKNAGPQRPSSARRSLTRHWATPPAARVPSLRSIRPTASRPRPRRSRCSSCC